MAVFTDSFDRADNATTLGAGWLAIKRNSPCAFGVQANQAYCSSGPSVFGTINDAMALRTGLPADFDMSVTIAVAPRADTGLLAWRVNVAADNGGDGLSYFVLIQSAGIYRAASNAGGIPLNAGSPTYVAGDVVRVTCVGDVHTVYKNGMQVAAFTSDFNNTAGAHGLAGDDPARVTGRFDAFRLAYTAPPLPPPPPPPTPLVKPRVRFWRS